MKKRKLEEWEDGYVDEDLSFSFPTMAHLTDMDMDDDQPTSDFNDQFPSSSHLPDAEDQPTSSSRKKHAFPEITDGESAAASLSFPYNEEDFPGDQLVNDEPYSSGWNDVGDFVVECEVRGDDNHSAVITDDLDNEQLQITEEHATTDDLDNEQLHITVEHATTDDLDNKQLQVTEENATTDEAPIPGDQEVALELTNQPSSSTPRRKRTRRVAEGTPRTENYRKSKMIYWRKREAITNIASAVRESLENNLIPVDRQGEVVEKALISCNMLQKVLDIHKMVKMPRGIRRTSDECIQLAWTFWNENSTVSNAQTNRPAKCSADVFDKDPLLCRINIVQWNIQENHTKRKKRQYHHQYQVQNATKEELFRKFKLEHPNMKIGITTFTKIKPFYVRASKSSDIETCTCRTHVNFRNAIEALLKNLRSKLM